MMNMPFEPTAEAITLHGLGFLQVPLGGDDRRRLHVWHPDLPRRRCFRHSSIHDHRFGFRSHVLVGVQINHVYRVTPAGEGNPATHIPYLHEGPRTAFGNRPWLPQDPVNVFEDHVDTIKAGDVYAMNAYVHHSTEPGGDGRVATIMTKTSEAHIGARSLCEVGIEPDADFDRKQWSPDRLWQIVRDVLEGGR